MWEDAVMLFDQTEFRTYFQDVQALAMIDGTGVIQEKFVRGITETVSDWIMHRGLSRA